MTLNIEELRADMRRETRKFAVQVVRGAAALLAAGVVIGRFAL